MANLMRYPLWVFVVTFVALWLASVAGASPRSRNRSAGDEQNEDPA
jgi:hypothetical protein